MLVLTDECRVLNPSNSRIVGFTDGSMLNFKGGVGVVLRGCGLHCSTGEPVNRPCNILECELLAINLALDYLEKFTPVNCKSVLIYSDCQVALRMIKGEIQPTYCSYQELVFETWGKLKKLCAGGSNLGKLVLAKVKAHVGVEGNELADSLANEFREKAQWGQTHDWTYCVDDSYAKATLKENWRTDFKEAARSYTGQSQFRRFVTEPTRKFVDVFKKMYRSDVHLVMSLLTDRLRLKTYEERFTANQNQADGNCTHCGVPETTEHFLFDCKEYSELREKLKKDLTESWKKFDKKSHFNGKTLIFGFTRKLAKGERREVKGTTQRKLWLCLAKFVRGSERFPHQFGGQSPPSY